MENKPELAKIIAAGLAAPAVMRAFNNAEDEVVINTLKGAARLDVSSLLRPQFMAEVEQEHPEYFGDLPALK